ncbi:MAG: GAF domain-containing sensor histidine kinase [Catalinimonas sp.]
MKASTPHDEQERLAALRRYEVLDTPAEPAFDDLVQLASQVCGTPVSLITLIDEDRQWFKGKVGIDLDQTPREVAFCAHAILQEEVMVVKDAREDERFADNPFVTADPDIRFYAGAPLITPDGYRLGTLCVIDQQPRELTDQQVFALRTLAKQVIDQLELRSQLRRVQRINENLEQLAKTQQQVISVISHDVRGPLANLNNVFLLLKEGGIRPQDFHLNVPKMQHSLEGTLQLINSLLRWTSAQLRGQEMQPVQLPLHPLAEEVLDELRMFDMKGNQLRNLVPPDLHVRADPDMLRFVLRNLLQNAVKYTLDGEVEIAATRREDRVEIRVRDTGVGMEETTRAHLFDADVRRSRPGTAGERGTGIGLMMSQTFIVRHGGEMRVESTEGRGSTFAFTLADNPARA